MFNNKIDTERIVPTSKMSLKFSCLSACGNDIDRATKLYDYLVADLNGLPDVDPQKVSGLASVMQGADNVLGWLGQHKDEIMQRLTLIRTMRGGGTITTPIAPPIPIE